MCLVYPNTYAVGMGNLGFQAVLRILSDDPHVTVDRAFLPDGPRTEWPRTLRALESDRPVGDFDVVAFSISFETDYLHVLDVLALAGLPLRRDARGAGAPLVLAGGPATFLNPEPLAEFVDLFLIGEAEEMLPEFLARAAAGSPGRDALLERTEDVVGAYRPDRFQPRYDVEGSLAEVEYDGPFEPRVVRRYLARARSSRDGVGDPEPGCRVRRHVPGRGEPRLRVGLPLLRRRLHVPSRALPEPRRAAARASRAGWASGARSASWAPRWRASPASRASARRSRRRADAARRRR